MAEPPATVFYDGACPVCSREIGAYRRLADGASLRFVDVARELPEGLDREAALRRLHLRLPDGRLVSGAAAFAEIWRRVPGFAWLGRVVGWAPVTPVAELAYRGFLRVRRLWR